MPMIVANYNKLSYKNYLNEQSIAYRVSYCCSRPTDILQNKRLKQWHCLK